MSLKKKKKSQPQAFQRSSPLQFSTQRTCMLDELSETWKNTILPSVNASDVILTKFILWQLLSVLSHGMIISERHLRINSNLLDFHTQTEDQKNQCGVSWDWLSMKDTSGSIATCLISILKQRIRKINAELSFQAKDSTGKSLQSWEQTL